VQALQKKKVIGGALGVILGVCLAVATPPSGLSPQAMWALGIIAWAITYWIFEVVPDYIVAVSMCTLWVLFRCVPFKTAFATFSDTTWWLLFGALGMGVAVLKSGLLKRLSLWLMNIFPANFNGQVLALICGGMVIAPLIPSVTAKAAIVAPISMGISDAMGYERKSRGAAGLFAAMGLGFILTGPMFLSASFVGYMMRGLLPQDIQAQFHWSYWFSAGLVWTAVVLGLMYLTIRFFYMPEEKEALSAVQVSAQLAALGPMRRNEKITATVLVMALLCWMAEPFHGINATIIALLGFAVLMACNVYDRQAFRSDMNWDSMIFIGGIINLGNVLPALKIDQWILQMCKPMLGPLMSNVYLFVVVLCIFVYVIRFVLVSFTATTAIFTVLLIPFALEAGINPWVTGFLVYVSTNIWLVFYQNSTFVTSFYAVGGEMVTHRQIIPFSVAYCIISIAAALLSIPYWQYLGLMP
jgi:anion transporter